MEHDELLALTGPSAALAAEVAKCLGWERWQPYDGAEERMWVKVGDPSHSTCLYVFDETFCGDDAFRPDLYRDQLEKWVWAQLERREKRVAYLDELYKSAISSDMADWAVHTAPAWRCCQAFCLAIEGKP